MNENKTVAIVGAGIGGIATALSLARHGYNVSVYEKNSFPAGRCGQIIREGHRFDVGATILMMPSIYRDVFQSMGLNFDESVEVKPLSSIYKIYFGDGKTLDVSSDPNELRNQLETIEKGSYLRFRSYIDKGYSFFQDSVKYLLGKNFYNVFEFINLRNVVLLFRLKFYLRHTTFIRRYFKHPNLRKAFTFQNIYLGQDPYKSSALFSMIPAAEYIEGGMFPVGGMHSIAKKLILTAQELGVKFYFDNAVQQIKIEKRKATELILSNGSSVNANIVVVNADLPYAYRELLPDKKVSARIDRLQYSCSALVFHWGLTKTYPQLSHHSVFLSDEHGKGLNMIFKEKSLSDNPSFYIHAPTRTDLSAAPANEDTLSIIIPSGHLDEKHKQKWDEIKYKTRKAVISRLNEIGITDIEDHIKFEIFCSPKTWNKTYNITRGSVFGSVGHNIMQMGYFRPHNRHNRYKNIYFTGGSTHPGNGVPLVLLSAKLVSERIIKEI